MPLKINSSGGGSVSINAPVTGSNFSLTVPANNATLITSDGGAITGNVAISGNLSVSGNNINPFGGMRNRIINGDMRIDQRNAGASVTPVNAQYLVDRWMYNTNQTSKMTFQQNAGSVTPPAGFANYLGGTVISAVTLGASDYVSFVQKIEGYNVTDLAWGTSSAKSVTLSFWVYSSLTGTYGGSLQGVEDVGGSYRSYPFTFTISSANTWTYVTITIPGDTSSPSTGAISKTTRVAIMLWFSLGVGSTYTAAAGSWQSGNYINATGSTSLVGTNGATFYITGVQLEVGTQATPFDWRPYGQELALCQRYYEYVGGIYVRTYVPTSGALRQPTFYKVRKRATPTVTIYATGNGQSGYITSAGTNYSIAQVSNGVDLYVWETGSSSTGNQDVGWEVKAEAEL